MNNLITVNYDTEQPTVSARDLHEALEIKERFSAWFGRIIKYFGEDEFTRVGKPTVVNNGAERILDDYLMTVDIGKHVCLMCKTEKGKQCRQYLIDLEKAWNTPEQIFARALKMADREIEKLKSQNTELVKDIDRMKPKEIFADAVATSHTSILVGELAKILRQNGVNVGQNRLFSILREEGYLIKRKGTDYNMPTQKSMDLGLFEIKEGSYTDANGCNKITKTTKVTGKGQQYFINRFLPDRQEVMQL